MVNLVFEEGLVKSTPEQKAAVTAVLDDFVEDQWLAMRELVNTGSKPEVRSVMISLENFLGSMMWNPLHGYESLSTADKVDELLCVIEIRINQGIAFPSDPAVGLPAVMATMCTFMAGKTGNEAGRQRALAGAQAIEALGLGTPEMQTAQEHLATVMSKPVLVAKASAAPAP